MKLQVQSNVPIAAQELRKFGLVFASIASVLFGILIPLLFEHTFPHWPWIFAACLVFFALLIPKALIVVYIPWMKFGEVAGWVNTRLILGLLFYLIITPIALLLKLIGKDLIDTKLDNSRASYRTTRELQDKNHMENPY